MARHNADFQVVGQCETPLRTHIGRSADLRRSFKADPQRRARSAVAGRFPPSTREQAREFIRWGRALRCSEHVCLIARWCSPTTWLGAS
jgi:hypothetical protein